jgi:ketosteroid isomerase-like protein
MNNVELLEQAYQDFGAGKIEAVVAIFDPEIEWNESQGLPFINGDGVFVGPSAIVENVLVEIPKHYDGFQIDIRELFGSEDKVVMVGYYRGIWKETGKEFKANATHVSTVKEGKVTHFFQVADTAEIISP